MNKFFNRIASTALAITMAASMTPVTNVFAAESSSVENGSYTATIGFYKAESTTSLSMCNSIFAHTADVTVTDDSCAFTFYVAYPIPAYPTMGTDGTLKDVVVTYGESSYTGTLDITTKAVKTFDETGSLFGITAGDELETEAVTVTLPRDYVDDMDETYLATSAYVNAVMYTTVSFNLHLSDLTATETEETVTETETKSTTVTATVVAPTATYTVTIPEAVELGTLSTEKDTEVSYEVTIETANFADDAYISVETDGTGYLTSGSEQLAYTNTFSASKLTASSTVSGTFKVLATDVANAQAGNYTGTANFVINYYAGK